MHELIDEYEENNFWDDLIDRLTDRDFHKSGLDKDREKMTFAEFMAKRDPFFDQWNEEIDKHGIERLEIKNGKESPNS